MIEQPIDQTGLNPGDTGYLGHRIGGGAKHKWRPRTHRNAKKLFRNREAWPRFKATAGIDGRITFDSAWKRARVHPFTLSHYVNGLTDCRMSTAMDLCDKLGCSLEGFAKALKEAWEITERRMQADEAIEEARADVPHV